MTRQVTAMYYTINTKSLMSAMFAIITDNNYVYRYINQSLRLINLDSLYYNSICVVLGLFIMKWKPVADPANVRPNYNVYKPSRTFVHSMNMAVQEELVPSVYFVLLDRLLNNPVILFLKLKRYNKRVHRMTTLK